MSPYLSIIHAALVLAGFEISIFRPVFFWWSILFLLVINVLFIWFSVRRKLNADFWNYLISPFFYLLGGLLFLGFADGQAMKQAVTVIVAIGELVYLYHLITYFYHKYKYKKHALSGISRVLNITSIFFLLNSFFNFHALLNIPSLLILIISAIVIYLTIYQFFCISRIRLEGHIFFIIISTLVLLELFYAVTWLPFLSHNKSLLIVSFYYLITGLSKHHLEGTLARSVYSRYFLVTGVIWIIVLLTSRWG